MASEPPRHDRAAGTVGTTTAYRKGCRCARCRAANTRQQRMRRSRAKQRGDKPILTVVGDGSETVQQAVQKPTAHGTRRGRALGTMEQAVTTDLASLSPEGIPGFHTFKGAALTIAKELDNVDSRASKAPLVKQLVDVMSKLTGKESGDGDTLEDLLSGLAQPVAGAPDRY